MLWSVDQDNLDGQSTADLLGIGASSGIASNVANNIKNLIQQAADHEPVADSCYWSDCDSTCKVGYYAQSFTNGQIGNVASSRACTSDGIRSLCCPSGSHMGTCAWEGWRGVGMPCSGSTCRDPNAVLIARASKTSRYDLVAVR